MDRKKDSSIIRESPVTYEEYANLPDDGSRYEIANGALELMTPAPTPRHQAISNQLQHTITSSCRTEYFIFAAPIDLILSQTEVRQPDLALVHQNNKSIITRRGIEGIPDLVVEIVSPHSIRRDRKKKLLVYAQYGIPEYWIVDPSNKALEQYIITETKTYELHEVYEYKQTVRSQQIPCVSFTMKNIMENVPDLPG